MTIIRLQSTSSQSHAILTDNKTQANMDVDVSKPSVDNPSKMTQDNYSFTTRQTYKANILQLTTATVGGSLIGGAFGSGIGTLFGGAFVDQSIKGGTYLKAMVKYGAKNGMAVGAVVGASIGSIGSIQSPTEGALKGLGLGFMASGVYGFVTRGHLGLAFVHGVMGGVSGAAAGYLSQKVQR